MGDFRGRSRPPPWWPHNESWPPKSGPEAQAWTRFGRRLARFAILSTFAVVVLPMLIGIVLAATIGGWTSVVIAVVSWIGIALVAAVALRFALRTWWPVRALIDATGRLAEGDYSARVPTNGDRSRTSCSGGAPTWQRPTPPGQLREVVRSFNRMADRLESAEDARRRLLADVGHELRTPLTIVRGEVEAMADGVHELDEDRLRLLLDDLATMERLLDDLQTLSTAEAGALRIHREPTDVVRLAADAIERLTPDADSGGVSLSLRRADQEHATDDPLDEAIDADVDPVRVREVLVNLVRNAIRATPPGGRVSVGVRSEVVEGETDVVITVCDTGAGIPPDQLERVFERFHKGSDSDGTGLGLTISRNLVEAHGGEITIASAQGRGTMVTARLPVGMPD